MKKALDKAALRKEIGRDLQAKARAKLVELRDRVRAAKRNRKAAIAEVKVACREGRKVASERAKLVKIEAAAAAKEIRASARTDCAANTVRAKSNRPIEEARKELADERAFRRSMRVIDRNNRTRAAERKTTTRERRSESDDEVRANLRADLLPLFERVKRSIKGSARRSRTEEFLEYAETHEGEAVEAMVEDGEAYVDRMLAEHEEAERRRRNPAPRSVAEERAVKNYARLHWGQFGNRDVKKMDVGDPRQVLTVLGVLSRVEYVTKKGHDKSLVTYFHDFSKREPPLLVVDRDGKLLIAGGIYKVETRGIVQ